MTDGRNGGGRKQPKQLREIPFEQIERDFRVTSMRLGGTTHPAVGREKDGGYFVRILVSAVRHGIDVTRKYDYFRTDPDGTVASAPRGYAKDYRPARITGMEEAVAKYAIGGES